MDLSMPIFRNVRIGVRDEGYIIAMHYSNTFHFSFSADGIL
jgi:hypothetical protein